LLKNQSTLGLVVFMFLLSRVSRGKSFQPKSKDYSKFDRLWKRKSEKRLVPTLES
jgi:hypothetical protein